MAPPANGSDDEIAIADAAAFAACARRFCSFVEGAAKLSLFERLDTARAELCALYGAATRLPRGEPDDEDAVSSPTPSGGIRFEGVDEYWEIFDPYELAAPVSGSLSDDVLDVYRDVRRGLALWDKGAHGAAVWEWRFGFDAHWGDHAVDALRVLHRACRRVTAAPSGSLGA